jgi:cysteine-rich repeat protein
VCGDGIVDSNEDCDDGDNDNGDGCSSTCAVETGWTCPSGSNCNAVCGDGVIISGIEACDNGGSNTCDCPWNASETTCNVCCACTVQTSPTRFCGDGVLQSNDEECDSGDSTHGAGNSDTTPDACRTNCSNPKCGDGVTDTAAGETCDDGNLVSGDGCSPICAQETGYDCSTGTCVTSCGDGAIAAGVETCEDNPPNAAIEDCVYDQESCMVCGSSCTSVPGNRIYCGDGVLQASEEACDDGLVNNSNVTPDKCRATCVLPKCGDGVVDTYAAMVLPLDAVNNGITRDGTYLMNNGAVTGASFSNLNVLTGYSLAYGVNNTTEDAIMINVYDETALKPGTIIKVNSEIMLVGEFTNYFGSAARFKVARGHLDSPKSPHASGSNISSLRGAATFDGDDHIKVVKNALFDVEASEALTAMTWFKSSPSTGNDEFLVYKEGGCRGWSIRLKDGKVQGA